VAARQRWPDGRPDSISWAGRRHLRVRRIAGTSGSPPRLIKRETRSVKRGSKNLKNSDDSTKGGISCAYHIASRHCRGSSPTGCYFCYKQEGRRYRATHVSTPGRFARLTSGRAFQVRRGLRLPGVFSSPDGGVTGGYDGGVWGYRSTAVPHRRLGRDQERSPVRRLRRIDRTHRSKCNFHAKATRARAVICAPGPSSGDHRR